MMIRVDGVNREMTSDEERDALLAEQEIADGALGRAYASLRTERDRLLAETDWTASSDVTMSPEMTTYRQALRDLPANTADVFNPVYPEKPE